MADTHTTGRIPELDGIRGIAIGAVLFYHYFFLLTQSRAGSALSYALAAGRLGWSGVDLFFVLSGFLIGGILLDARESSNYFRVFYTRRFFRIVPVYYLCLVAAFAWSYLVHLGLAHRFDWMPPYQLPWVPYLIFLQNFWMAHRTSLGSWGLGATWSLAVEEQFYLTLPLLIRFVNPRRLLAVVISGIALAPALRIMLYALWPEHFFSWFILMPCRADSLLLGVLAAMAIRNPSWREGLARHRGTMRFLLGLFAIGFIILTLKSPSAVGLGTLTIGFTWLALFYVCILLYGLLFRDSWLSRCLRWSWLGWLGSIAYGVYLLHEFLRPIFFGLLWSPVPATIPLRDQWVSVLALIVTLVLCRVSWVYFEKPLVRLGHRARYEFNKVPLVQELVPLRKTEVETA